MTGATQTPKLRGMRSNTASPCWSCRRAASRRWRGFRLLGTPGGSSVQVTAFKPSEDGKAWIVRLFGVSGKNEKVTLDVEQVGAQAALVE